MPSISIKYSTQFRWQNNLCTVYCANSLKLMPSLGHFDFVFADPPFNIGQHYMDYADNKEPMAYDAWTALWVRACWEQCKGVMVLHGSDELAVKYLELERTLNLRRVAWVNWHYRFGQCRRGNWIDARAHCLIYAKHADYTWNPNAVLVESDRVAYGDERINATVNGGKRLPGTAWGAEIDLDSEAWELPSGIETARPIPRFSNYLASTDGQIFSTKRGELTALSQRLDSTRRYLRVCISDDSGREVHVTVHSLVCAAFNGHRPNGMVCRHLNGISTDNRAENLVWGTHKENCEDRDRHGRTYHPTGDKNVFTKLSDDQVVEIRELSSTGKYTQSEIGEIFGISQTQVSRIASGKRWKIGHIWGVPSDGPCWGRVQGNSQERRLGHPNQLPEVYLQRLLLAYTNKGDKVLDPFGGSGTTAVVAQALGRQAVTVDISEASCRSMVKRLKRGAVRI